ncbi:MAG: hypothetical protein D6785_12360 [Planctomycetota bacterium]|nr:MAG: hypothetical protein D6785_12360 [Planctomycetota bacterium]
MSKFSYDKQEDQDRLVLYLKGHIDEDINFSEIDISNHKKIYINLKDIKSINSCGIREWIRWLQTASPETQFTFAQCPKIIVDQINMVSGFLPEGAEVESFFVPYYCEETGNEKMILFEKGKEFKDGEVFPPEEVLDDETGDPMEMDVLENKYFKFLKQG